MRTRTRLLTPLAGLIAFALACSLGAPAAIPQASTTGTGSTPDAPSTTEAPNSGSGGDPEGPAPIDSPEDLPPGDYYEAMMAEVDSGLWTYEEGLLSVLRAAAGRGEDPFAQTELGEREFTGVIREARRYLREGEDPAVRAEIDELLGVIVPSPDRLQEYSRPEGESRRGYPGLAAPAMTNPKCEDLYTAGFPPDQDIICYLVAQAPMGAEGVDVYYPADWASDPGSKAFADAAKTAVLDAWKTYKPFGTMGSVGVVFAMLQSGGASSLAEVPSESGDVSCLIVIYPLALTKYTPGGSGASGIDGFKQTVAHEMFHCFQGWNYPEHFDDWSAQRWWGEGSAEYFSNLVYPAVNKEWNRFPYFIYKSANQSIFQMAYENTLFFQFLEKKIQPQGLISLFHLLPTGQPHLAHMKMLSEYAGMSDYWHEFGRAIIDQKLVDTSGAAIPASWLPDYWTDKVGILATQAYDLPARDFVLTRYDVALGGGLGYHLQAGTSDDEVLPAARPIVAPPWTGVKIDRDAGCARYAVLVTSLGTSGVPRTFKIDAVVDQPNQGGVCDTCVLGRWRMSHQSYSDIFQTVTQGAEALPVDNLLTSGDLELEARSDGTLLAEALPFGVQTIGSTPGLAGESIPLTITVQFSGSSLLDYLAMEGEFLTTLVSPGIQTKSQADLGGQVIEGLLDDAFLAPFGAGPEGAQSHFTYTCTPTELRMWATEPIYDDEPWIYQKVPQP
jgi:hypothetical protein